MRFLIFRDLSIRPFRNIVLLISILLVSFVLSGEVKALNQEEPVVEYLRLHVPADNLQAWLQAEEGSWSVWLRDQKGFIGRQLFWDKENNEGLILIRWSSRKDWKSISRDEMDLIQGQFEFLARELTAQSSGNPFPLSFEGELIPQ